MICVFFYRAIFAIGHFHKTQLVYNDYVEHICHLQGVCEAHLQVLKRIIAVQ
jgi:hypothetical protein